jgi:hypothetical protein
MQGAAACVLPEAAGGVRSHGNAERQAELGDMRWGERPECQYATGELSPSLGKRVVRGAAHDQQNERTAGEQPASGEQQRAQRLGVDQVSVIHDNDAWRVVRPRADQLQQLEANRDVPAGA